MADSDKDQDPTGADQDPAPDGDKDKPEDKPAEDTDGDGGKPPVGDDKDGDKPPEDKPTRALEEYSIEEILKAREDVSKFVQSTKDKAATAVEKKIREEITRREADSKSKAEEEELRHLIEEQDYEEIGKRRVTKMREEDDLQTQAVEFSALLERTIREHPEVAELGEEAVKEVFDAVKASGGNAVDFMAGLFRKRSETALTAERKAVREELMTEVDAKFAELGLAKREKADDDGETPAKDISGGTGGQAKPPETWEEATDRFNAGDLPWEDYKPFWDAHEKARAK